MSDQIYRKLQERLDTHPVGFAASTDSSDIELLKHIFSTDQAEIMCRLDRHYQSTEEIYSNVADLVGSQQQLARILHGILKNGGIFYRKEGAREMWAIAPLVVGMYEWQVDRLNPEMLDGLQAYWQSPKTPPLPQDRPMQLRVIPIEKAVSQDLLVATFDELRATVQKAGNHISLVECICRKKRSMQGGSCTHTSRNETCMAFNYWAEQAIAQGIGKRLSQEEALAVLAENQKEGMVLMPSNSKTIEFLCSCCSDCCGTLNGLRSSDKPAEIASTNYHAIVQEQSCIGCACCADACPMEAIEITDGIAQIDWQRCIGCGVCVVQCDSEAIRLMKKSDEIEPPATLDDLFEVYHKGR